MIRNVPIKSAKDLREAITAVRYSIPPETCKKLVHSMPNRVFDLNKAKGLDKDTEKDIYLELDHNQKSKCAFLF